MKLSSRDRYLINQAFEAGYEGLHASSKEWLASDVGGTGDVVEDHLAFDADQIVEDDERVMFFYVLTEETDAVSSVLGVFDSPNVEQKVLVGYYGPGYKEISHRLVEDSGVEWVKVIELHGEQSFLTLCSYTLNEI